MASGTVSPKIGKVVDIPNAEAPTIGSPTAIGTGKVSVAFTAGSSSTTGGPVNFYTATSTPGSITGSAASSPITVFGLTDGTAYTFTVAPANGTGTGGNVSGVSSSITPATVGAIAVSSNSVGNTVMYQYDTKVDSSGNIYYCGYGYNSSNGYEGFVFKTDSTGAVTWQRGLYGSAAAASRNDASRCVAVDSSGNVYVSGQYYNTSSRASLYITKYNSSGTVQLSKYLDNPVGVSSQFDTAYGLTVDSGGNIILVADIKNSSAGLNAYILKLDSSFTVSWQKRLAGPAAAASQNEYPQDVVTDSSNNIYVPMYSHDGTRWNGVIAKYNSTGTYQWARKIYGTTSSPNLQSAVVDSAGNVYAAGVVNNGSGNVGFIGKWNSSGTLQWQRHLAAATTSDGLNLYGIGIDSSDNIYVAGTKAPNSTAVLAKYNSSGTIQWQRIFYNNNPSTPNISIMKLRVVGSNVYMTGYGTSLNTGFAAEGVTVKVPTDGSGYGPYTLTVSGKTSTFVYNAGNMVDSAGSATEAAYTMTDNAVTFTISNGMTSYTPTYTQSTGKI